MPRHDGKPTQGELARAAAGWRSGAHVKELQAKPMCAVCGRPVERMIEEEDEHRSEVIFTASCHGQRERITIPMGDSRLKGISFGVAFADAPRRLDATDDPPAAPRP